MAERRPVCVRAELRRCRIRPCHRGLDVRRSCAVRTGVVLMTVVVAACLPASLQARSTDVHVVVALGSQLVERGVAITPATPVMQGAASWTSPAGRWSLGLSGSVEVRSPGHMAETLLQASHYWRRSSDWQVQVSLLYYRYSGTARSRTYDRAEAGIHWTYRDTLTFGLSAARNIDVEDHRTRAAADLDLHWPVLRHLALSMGAGVAQTLAAPHDPDYDQGDSYRYRHESVYHYGHAGLMWSDGPWRVELDRIMTDLDTSRQRYDPRAAPWVATISRSF